MNKWDNVYQDEIDESISIKVYNDREKIKRACKKWNKRTLKNSKYPAFISFLISLSIIFFLKHNNIIKDDFTIFGFKDFTANFMVFGLIFMILFGIISGIIQGLFLFFNKKSNVEYTGNYDLNDEK